MDYVSLKKFKDMNNSLIYGTLLGDAWIYKDKKGNYLFAFQQHNKDYARWKADLLDLPYKEYHVARFDKRTLKTYTNLTIHLKLPVETKRNLHQLFYTPKKRVTLEILNQLTPQGICLWYLDDGNMYYNSNNCHITLSVDSFTVEEQMLILTFFSEVYDIKFTKTKRNIRLTSKHECEKFMNLIEEFIPDCMNYKKLKVAMNIYKMKKKL